MILCLGTTPTLARTMQFARICVDGVNRAVDVYEYAAGKAVNAARAAVVSGVPVSSIAPCGGAIGQRLAMRIREAFGTDGVIVETSADSRLCVTAIDRAARTSTELIQEPASLTIAEGEALFEHFAARVTPGGVAVLGGSLAPGLGADYYARCVAAALAAGARTIVDTSGVPLVHAIDAAPTVIKVNASELAGVASRSVGGDEAGVVAAAHAMATRTRGWVIVTRGAASTIAVHGNAGVWRAGVPQIDAVSAIGSGDSFDGGLAAAMLRDMPMHEALRWATACATANVLSPHAAHFTLKLVDELLPRIAVERIA